MSNILMLHEGEQPTLLSLYTIMCKFAEKHGCNVKKQYTNRLSEKELNWADIIICVRGESPATYAELRCARENGKYTVYFLDDDLKDMPKGSFRYPGRRKWLLKTIKQCSLLFTSSQLLADEYKEYVLQHRTALINTAVPEGDITKCPNDNEVTKIVYAASEWHISNFDAYIKPILPQLFAQYKKGIELYFIGLHPDVDVGEYSSQIHYIPGMSMQKYHEYMLSHHFDIGLAPLVTNHFTERKYFNKYIEYAKFGICGIYSDVLPYRLAVKDGWNGYLSENTPEAWLGAVKRAIDDKDKRERIIDTAQQHLRDEHNEEKIFERLLSDIPELISYKAPEMVNGWPAYIYCYKLRYTWFRFCELVYLTTYSLIHFGLDTTFEKIKRKVKITK